MPPTGRKIVSFGNTARIARSTGTPTSSAGNSFSASAPARRAAKPSVGVATPGMQTMPACLAAVITAVSPCGMTISRPPASPISVTCRGVITVPAPIRQLSPKRCTSRRMLSSGRGEFIGTSRMVMPAATSASPTATASSGVSPRRMAVNGVRPSRFVVTLSGGIHSAPTGMNSGSRPAWKAMRSRPSRAVSSIRSGGSAPMMAKARS